MAELNYQELATKARIVKVDRKEWDPDGTHKDIADLYHFDFSGIDEVELSAIGEHADSEAEAIEKVAARITKGASTGNYLSPEDEVAAADRAAKLKAEAEASEDGNAKQGQ